MYELARLDMSWVREKMVVGARVPCQGLEFIASRLAIRSVLTTCDEITEAERRGLSDHGISYLHLPLYGGQMPSMKALTRGVDWAAARIQSGSSLLVQCEYGVGRSVLVTACLLVRLGDAPSEALSRIKRARPCVTPSPIQLDAFSRWCALQSPRPPRADDSRRFAIHP